MAHHSLAHSLAFSAMEKTIATALSLDPAARHRIKALSGKVISIQTRSPAVDVLLLFNSNGINLFAPELSDQHNEDSTPYDASIESPSFEFIKQLIKTQSPLHVLDNTNSELVISGDRLLVEECRAIFRDLDIDWEESLSHLVGDIAAHQIGRHTRSMLRWAKKAASTLKQDTQEYLQYESQTFVAEFEYLDFATEVTQLEQAVNDLASRINTLKASNTPTHQPKQQTPEPQKNPE